MGGWLHKAMRQLDRAGMQDSMGQGARAHVDHTRVCQVTSRGQSLLTTLTLGSQACRERQLEEEGAQGVKQGS